MQLQGEPQPSILLSRLAHLAPSLLHQVHLVTCLQFPSQMACDLSKHFGSPVSCGHAALLGSSCSARSYE